MESIWALGFSSLNGRVGLGSLHPRVPRGSRISSQPELPLYPFESCCYRLAVNSFSWVSGVDAVDGLPQCPVLPVLKQWLPLDCPVRLGGSKTPDSFPLTMSHSIVT